MFRVKLERQIKHIVSTIVIEVKAKNETQAANLAEQVMGKNWRFRAIVR